MLPYIRYTDKKNVTNFLQLVLHLACKVTSYFQLFSSGLLSVLRTSINVLSKSKSRNYVTWIANLIKLFLSVQFHKYTVSFQCVFFPLFMRKCIRSNWLSKQEHIFIILKDLVIINFLLISYFYKNVAKKCRQYYRTPILARFGSLNKYLILFLIQRI